MKLLLFSLIGVAFATYGSFDSSYGDSYGAQMDQPAANVVQVPVFLPARRNRAPVANVRGGRHHAGFLDSMIDSSDLSDSSDSSSSSESRERKHRKHRHHRHSYGLDSYQYPSYNYPSNYGYSDIPNVISNPFFYPNRERKHHRKHRHGRHGRRHQKYSSSDSQDW